MRIRIAFLLLLTGMLTLRGQDLVPAPAKLVKSDGVFTLGLLTRLVATGEARAIAERLREDLRPATGLPLPLAERGETDAIRLILDPKSADLGEEGYRLVVKPDRVEIRASKAAGLFYGTRTLLQLCPVAIFRQARVQDIRWTLPCVAIEDQPRFAWRGSHLDVARHFMPKHFIKRHLDLMALHKLNVFQWHLTEDQGWRIEIKKYPRLTEVGAWRRETVIPEFGRLISERPNQLRFDNTPHGGFYSQDDVREIVRYAADRFITVVPEIEMPGHCRAALAAYPELGNNPGQPVEVATWWGVFDTIYNVNDRTLQFNKDVLTEILDLFPSRFIHIGGDEVPKSEWARSPEALKRMKELGLVPQETSLGDLQNYRNEKGQPAEHPALHQLQSWFVGQMDAFLAARGRRLIGWDEILEGGLAPGATVMSWRGETGGIAAARAGHDVVMAPAPYTYLNNYQFEPPRPELFAAGNGRPTLTLAKVYGYEPVPSGLNAEETRHVLGAQAEMWTEYLPTPARVEDMAWPRLAAFAEVCWAPKESRDFRGFLDRLNVHLKRLDALDVNYRPLEGVRGYHQR